MKENSKQKSETEEPVLEKERVIEKMIEDFIEKKRDESEKKELLSEQEKIDREKLEKEIIKIKLSSSPPSGVQKKTQQIKGLDKKEKLKYLLDLAEKKGLIFAIRVAENMKDPYILDIFHDILAKGGFYKKLKK